MYKSVTCRWLQDWKGSPQLPWNYFQNVLRSCFFKQVKDTPQVLYNMKQPSAIEMHSSCCQSKKQLAVIGIGNTLLGDEGIGVHVIESMRKNFRFSPKVALVDGGCGGLNLYFILERYDPVIIIDALTPDAGPPGSICLINDDLLSADTRKEYSAHSVGLKDALILLQSLAAPPGDLVLVGVVPVTLKFNLGLSPKIKQRLPSVEKMVVRQLELRNIEVSEK